MSLLLHLDMSKKITLVKVIRREVIKNRCMIVYLVFKTSPMTLRGITFLMTIDAQHIKVHTVEISSLKKY